MISLKNKTYTDKVKIKIKILWAVVLLMLAYMIAVGGIWHLGDSRIMTPLADKTSKVIFFGGLIYVGIQIFENKKYLKNKKLLIESEKQKSDERRQYIYDKSGGIVADVLLIIMLFVTCTAALWNMPAFYTAFILLAITIVLKTASYLYYNKKY